MSAVMTFALAGAATFGLRCAPMLAGNAIERAGIDRWIRLVSPAALAAIVAGSIALDRGRLATPDVSEIIALVAAAAAARASRNVAVSLIAGLATYWFVSVVTV